MKKLFIILYLLTNIFVLGACGDVESEGDPQPRVPRVEVESDDYYVQITQENMDGVAFVYRWLDIETASKYVMTLGLQVDGEITETMGVEDKSILTYNGVREQLFTNQLLEWTKKKLSLALHWKRFSRMVCQLLQKWTKNQRLP